ncbi:MAG: MmcQ/YjbR family DNA-binding protein [Clostridia bacterium]|nr:MmcQ/YjbR family DNA-binding protein [Clostridia bacterium]
MTIGATRATILEYALGTYGTEPDNPFRDSPEAAVLRHEGGRKWYALILRVSRKALGVGGEGAVDVLNVKADPILAASLRGQAGFLPAYHMNKERWISILLDGSVEMEQARALLDMSYDLTGNKRPRAAKAHAQGQSVTHESAETFDF